jgi:hypothetical protein
MNFRAGESLNLNYGFRLDIRSTIARLRQAPENDICYRRVIFRLENRLCNASHPSWSCLHYVEFSHPHASHYLTRNEML